MKISSKVHLTTTTATGIPATGTPATGTPATDLLFEGNESFNSRRVTPPSVIIQQRVHADTHVINAHGTMVGAR